MISVCSRPDVVIIKISVLKENTKDDKTKMWLTKRVIVETLIKTTSGFEMSMTIL